MAENFHISLEHLPTPVLLCDPQGRIRSYNSKAQSILGRPLEATCLNQVLDFSQSDLKGCQSLADVLEVVRQRRAEHHVVSLPFSNPPVSHLSLHVGFMVIDSREWVCVAVQDVSESRKLVEAFEYKERLLDSIIRASTDALIAFDQAGCIELFSPAAELLFGRTATEMIIEDVFSLFDGSHRDRVREILNQLISDESRTEALVIEDIAPINAAGVPLPASISFSKSVDSDNSLFFMIVSDKSAFHRFVNSVNDAYVKTDSQGIIIDVNRRAEALFLYDRRELIGRPISFLALRCGAASDIVTDISELAESNLESEDFTASNRVGDELFVNLTVWPQDLKQVRLNNLIIRDISHKKAAERQLVNSAFTDSLTQLANRAKFIQTLNELVTSGGGTDNQFALIAIDLDRFKEVNDTFGHDCGDDLLRMAAARLRGCVRNHDLVYRLGGDEFTVIIRELDSTLVVDQIVERILGRFREDFFIKSKRVTVSSSIGIALFPRDSHSADGLYKAADMAMYAAKRAGKNCYKVFTLEMHQQYERHKAIERALAKAVENNELSLHFQPKISYSQGRLVGFEALLRWHHPELGHVSPAEFIPIAEESSIIFAITRWVLATGMKAMKQWEHSSEIFRKHRPSLAVNISADHFKHSLLLDLKASLEAEQFDAGLLEIEITEGVLLNHTADVIDCLRRISELGIHISLDDFGTGYSSLQYLKHFKLNTIKIDRSFVRDIERDDHSVFLIESIVSVAKRLHLNLVAEGVETEHELQRLIAMDCDVFQGYYYSKPLPEQDVIGYLEKLDQQLMAPSSPPGLQIRHGA